MTTTRDLVVRLRAVTKDFDAKMKRASASVKRFGADFGSQIAEAKGATLGAVAAVAGLRIAARRVDQFTTELAEGLDVLGKWSERLNISASRLAGWQFAAEQSGSTADAINRAFFQLSRTIGESISGNEEYAQTFRDLGLSVEKLARLDVDQQFLAVTQALNKQESQALRTAAAQDILGRGARELAVLYQQTADAQANLVQEGERLRGVTEARTKAAARLIDAENKQRKAEQRIKESTAFVLELEAAYNELKAEVLTAATNTDNFVKAGEAVAKAWAPVTFILDKVAGSYRSIADRIRGAVEPITTVRDVGIQSGIAIQTLRNVLRSLQPQVERIQTNLDATATAIEAVGWQADNTTRALGSFGRAFGFLDLIRRTRDELNELTRSLHAQGEILTRELETPFERHTRLFEEYTELLKRGAISAETYRRALARLYKELADAQDAPEEPEAPARRRAQDFRQVVLNRLALDSQATSAPQFKKPTPVTIGGEGLNELKGIRALLETPRPTVLAFSE